MRRATPLDTHSSQNLRSVHGGDRAESSARASETTGRACRSRHLGRDYRTSTDGPVAQGAALDYGDQRGSQDDLSSQLPQPCLGDADRGRAWRPAGAPARPRPAPAAAAVAAAAVVAPAATYWFLTGQPQQAVREDTVKRFNAAERRQHHLHRVPERRVQDEDQDCPRRRSGPDDHLGLGRRRPREYVKATRSMDLTDWFNAEPGPERTGGSRPRSSAATVDGKIYAMPAETVTPILFYWNKKVLDKIGVAAPADLGRHHAVSSRSPTPRASRPSPSAASPAGRT